MKHIDNKILIPIAIRRIYKICYIYGGYIFISKSILILAKLSGNEAYKASNKVTISSFLQGLPHIANIPSDYFFLLNAALLVLGAYGLSKLKMWSIWIFMLILFIDLSDLFIIKNFTSLGFIIFSAISLCVGYIYRDYLNASEDELAKLVTTDYKNNKRDIPLLFKILSGIAITWFSIGVIAALIFPIIDFTNVFSVMNLISSAILLIGSLYIYNKKKIGLSIFILGIIFDSILIFVQGRDDPIFFIIFYSFLAIVFTYQRKLLS